MVSTGLGRELVADFMQEASIRSSGHILDDGHPITAEDPEGAGLGIDSGIGGRGDKDK